MNEQDSDTQPEPQPEQAACSDYRGKGKVARLPKAVRDKLNIMLLDGLTYGEILKALGDAAKGVTERNITSWVQGGYKAWISQQRNLDETRVKQEVAMDLACPEGGSKIHEATLQLAATSLSEMLRELNCSSFQELLRDDPAQLTALLNSLARISDAEIRCERHRLESEAKRAKLDNEPSCEKGLRPETRQRMEKELNLK